MGNEVKLTPDQRVGNVIHNQAKYDLNYISKRLPLADRMGEFGVPLNLEGPINAHAMLEKSDSRAADVAATVNYLHGHKELALEQFAAIAAKGGGGELTKERVRQKRAKVLAIITRPGEARENAWKNLEAAVLNTLRNYEEKTSYERAIIYGALGLRMASAAFWLLEINEEEGASRANTIRVYNAGSQLSQEERKDLRRKKKRGPSQE